MRFSLFLAERLKKKLVFFSSQIKLQRIVFPHVKNEFDRRTGSYKKKKKRPSVEDCPLGSGSYMYSV